ncbi:tyrosine-type recombinase/integrase [Luteimonas terricola]|uniref:Core-binding (CB) domain-containing protein n=1 Tax=Luteimonas terricola TaxID=645597 RepID=A0ABQ2ECP2_9GAMM|nr:Arm DNA-binding domain-containing protein [Luteimonas terricola]GGK06944.1 hypothetical protein GCM10011394_15180 [Luteimonas terricola]
MGKLTEKALRALKPEDRIYNVADGAGLSIEVWPNGGAYWRFRYRFAGKAKRLSLGVYPEVSLREARDSLTTVRALLRSGIDPSQDRREAKAALLTVADREFTKVAADWLAHQKPGWAPETYRKAAYIVDQYLAEHLKGADIATLGTPEARRAIGAIAARVPALAQKARGHLGSIVEFAAAYGWRRSRACRAIRGFPMTWTRRGLPRQTTTSLMRPAIRADESPMGGPGLSGARPRLPP